MCDPFWPPACPATVSLPNFAREPVSAPLQVPAGADFGSLFVKEQIQRLC